ncbi:MAG: hypothetical protein L0H25_00130 [Micrococcales bacterium]|nr:hypothetical protein [Micrococcales bacterium]
MTTWTETIPVFAFFALLTFLPGWLVLRWLGARGLEAVAASPVVTATVLAVAPNVAALIGLRWSWLLVIVSTLAFAGAGWLVARVLGAHDEDITPARRLLGRPRLDVVVACAIGIGIALVTILPVIARPDELVDSPDAVFHLNRIRLFLDTGDFSMLNPSFYPNGFHAWVATAMLGVGSPIIAVTNVGAIFLAAVVWPIGCVALVRHALTTSRLVTYAAGFASAAFVAFPTLLLGWGVLWPNLMGTAMTPAALVLMLQAARTRAASHVLAFAATLPGLALIQPNALFALVVFAIAWYLSSRVRAGVLGHHSWRRVARDLAIALVVLAAGVVAAPMVSASIASTQSYTWQAIPLWEAVGQIIGGRLQIYTYLWGLLVLLLIGIGWIVVRARVALPVIGMWLACVTLYLLAASSTATWTHLLTGYWYNDKVRLASLAAVPGVVIVAAAAPALRSVLERALQWVPGTGRRRTIAALLALAAIPLGTVVADAGARSAVLHYFFYPRFPERVIASRAAQASMGELAALIPPGAGVVGRPENGSPLMYALFDTNTFYRSIPVLSSGDNGLIGAGFDEMTTRPEVCAALRRHNIRYAIDSPHVYWLDHPERTSGLFHLDRVAGLEKVATAGDYTLYRITACGLGS